MMNTLLVFGLMLMGLVGIVLYLVTAALRDALRRMADINEQLLLLVSMGQHGEGAARALVAKAQAPRRNPPVEAEKKPEQKPTGVVVTYGAA